MTENDEFGCHFVGYFSKEKRPSSLNNVSCILVLPIHQRRGFGHLLIDFSYLLTRVEQKTGSPEKPLSDMGLVSYRSYWRLILCYQLIGQEGPISISDISDNTGMTADDIICALEGLRALVRDPITRTYALRLDYPFFRQYIANYEAKGYTKLDPDALMWVPYVMGRDNMHYENAAPLHTVAQREEEQEPIHPEEGVQQFEAQEAKSSDHVSPQDSDFMTPGNSTPQEETFDNTLMSTDAPSGQLEPERQPSSPTKPNSNTPWIEGTERNSSPIPATRFEIFPPLPGTATRKRTGRGFGRGTNRRGTPVRRGLSFGEPGPSSTTSKPTTTRRTRSKLADMLNGDNVDRDDVGARQSSPGPTPSGAGFGSDGAHEQHGGANQSGAEDA